jgi:hypothetical protein
MRSHVKPKFVCPASLRVVRACKGGEFVCPVCLRGGCACTYEVCGAARLSCTCAGAGGCKYPPAVLHLPPVCANAVIVFPSCRYALARTYAHTHTNTYRQTCCTHTITLAHTQSPSHTHNHTHKHTHTNSYRQT